ncbi:MAG: SGNH/GDSL hydrolase family protein [Ferruginibacter sp.]
MRTTIKKIISITTSIVLTLYINLSAMAAQKEMHYNDSVKTILFVGNSLTYANDLPGIVARLGKEKGIKIKTEMIAYPDYSLEDHWNDGELQKLLAANHYDFVIIQQGPSSQEEGRTTLLDYGARIKTLCEKNNARLAFFMVWPAFVNFNNFDGVIKNYSDAATATHSILCPVGQVWKKYFLETNNYSYYSSDKFHPSKKGSEVAAMVIFETLFK